MKTDPNHGCANVEERLLWALLHDIVAHPLMGITLYSKLSLRFHDWTSHKAWPRPGSLFEPDVFTVWSEEFGWLDGEREGMATDGDSYWTIEHPRIRHSLTVKAPDVSDAIRQAEQWFVTLREVDLL